MAKRSKSELPSIIEEELKDEHLDIEPVALYTKVEQSKKRLQSVFSAHLKITGRTSGKLYEWAKAGDVVDVWAEDVEDLLQKRIGNSACCGGVQRGNLLLKIVD